jgi:glycine cleavage system H protein
VSGETPSHLRYTQQHEWTRDDGEVVSVGITHYAQDQLGDVVYVDLPAADTEVVQGQVFGEVESTKSVSDLYAPVSGIVVETNDALVERPELVNQDPYGDGWMVRIRPNAADQLDGLMDASAYQAFVEG